MFIAPPGRDQALRAHHEQGRPLSKFHATHPYVFHFDGNAYTVRYDPGESRTELFGGNSNWRGPIWFPLNYLLIESISKFSHYYYGDDFTVECPNGSGHYLTLKEVADELSQRLIRLFLRDESDRRPSTDYLCRTGSVDRQSSPWTRRLAKFTRGDLLSALGKRWRKR